MIIPFPAIEPLFAQEWGITFNTQGFRSPLTRSLQTVELPGAGWQCKLTIKVLTRAELRLLSAWLLRLRGQAGRCLIPNFAEPLPAGLATGSPVVAGAGQTGSALLTSGWTPNTAGILLAGDFIGVGGKLKMVVADAASDSSGNATLSIEPPIYPGQAPLAGSAIIVDRPTCTMLLNDNTALWTYRPVVAGDLVIELVEDVLA